MVEISDDAIRERAYQIWVREGCPHGRDFEHWLQAEVELTAETSPGNGGSRAAAPRARRDGRKAPPAKSSSKGPTGRTTRSKRSS
jgi:hypothetical protein